MRRFILILHPSRTLILVPVAVLVLAFLPGPSPASTPVPDAVEIGPGKLADPVVCAADPELSYALYLPTSYDPDRTWPVVFLFDSEGRGAELTERFRRGADLYGFALVASNDTAHDTPWEINQRVVRILLADAFRHVAIDSSRLHFAGFSGTARLAWSAAIGFRDAVTGVLLMGGTTPGSELPAEAPPFPVFAITATEDFNHDEAVRFDAELERLGAKTPTVHRLEVFEGANEWPPEPLLTTALGWFHLQAMKSGRVETDRETLAFLLRTEIAAARESEETGDLLAAAEQYRAIVRDFQELGDALTDESAAGLAEARSRAEELQGRKEVKKARAAARKRQNDAEIYRADLAGAIVRLRRDRKPPQPNRLLTDLKIPLLQKRLESEDPEDARSARRMLELAYVYTSLYLPSELMARDLYRHAASSLTVAAAIHPENPALWLGIARAYAKAGERKEALEALAKARETGASEETIAADEDLAGLATALAEEE